MRTRFRVVPSCLMVEGLIYLRGDKISASDTLKTCFLERAGLIERLPVRPEEKVKIAPTSYQASLRA